MVLPFVAAALPGIIGFVVADLMVFSLGPLNVPLVPFILIGWLVAELAARRLRPEAGGRPSTIW